MRISTPIFLATMLIMTITLGMGCEHRPPETVAHEEEELPSQEGWDSRLIITQDGRRQAVVEYGHMRTYDSRRISYFDEGVTVDFFNRHGDHTSHLTSDAGEYHENTEDVIAIGNVVVVSDSGTTLHTERLRWHQRREKIFSDTLVMVTTTSNDTLYGIGFESEPDLTRWIIQEPWGVSDRRVAVERIDEHFERTRADSTIADSMSIVAAVDSVAGKAEARSDSAGVRKEVPPDSARLRMRDIRKKETLERKERKRPPKRNDVPGH